jgi:hypothetical protein
MSVIVPSTAAGRWPSNSIAAPDLMAALQDRLPVTLISTPRHALHTCRSDEALSDVISRNSEGFDYFPVIEASSCTRERIVGLVELVPYLRGEPPNGIVGDHMQPLSEDNLIGADAGILAFIKTADHHGCRLVMSAAEISGLVCLADLQRLPVRAVLFALITHLEMVMAAAIRREFDGSQEWKGRLSGDRLKKLTEKRDQANAADNLVEDLLLTEFSDKVTIIRKSPSFTNGRERFKDDMRNVRALRDNLAHANEYAATRYAAAKVCETVRRTEHWIERLHTWLPEGPRATET